MALKLDMSKAYDRIEWKFLREVMIKMGFNEWWTHLILQYVSTVQYSIIHGEFEIGPIRPSRGLRQGDPLSPYLFIICAEGLSALIRQYETQKWLQGISICRRAPNISHMLFADDSYMFCKADIGDTRKVLELMDVYERASGQRVNR
ncbi:secreted RxLR effector protein 78-like [Apium graveolens]|uniref:secreted RxLR effector protein 78-like n=1 Tax=Apium graveolens TaxID=4045 RepID=UPI003D7A9DF5